MTDDFDDRQRAQRKQTTAEQVSEALASAQGLEQLFDAVVDSVFAAINAERAALMLRECSEGLDELRVVAARLRPGDEEGLEEIMVSRAVMQDVLETGRSHLRSDPTAEMRKDWTVGAVGMGIRWVMCVPVRTDESVIGVLYADREALTGGRPVNDLELLALIGNLAGVAIYRAR